MRRYKFWHTCFIYFIFFSFALTLTLKAEAKPRGVNLEEELPLASIILPVKILAYDAGALKFQPIGKTTVMSAK